MRIGRGSDHRFEAALAVSVSRIRAAQFRLTELIRGTHRDEPTTLGRYPRRVSPQRG